MLLWVSTGKVPGVISALMVLPVVWESVSAGIRSADPQLLELARSYQFSRRKQMRCVTFRRSETTLCRRGVHRHWPCMEIPAWPRRYCASPKPPSAQVYYSKNLSGVPSLFAWTAVVIVLSMLRSVLSAACWA